MKICQPYATWRGPHFRGVEVEVEAEERGDLILFFFFNFLIKQNFILHNHNNSNKSTMLAQKTSPFPIFLHKFRRNLRSRPKFRCILDHANVIAAAAASGKFHGAVTSAITQVAVSAVAIASGACLSTKVDFLWPKVEEQPGNVLA